jgi:hypothetical protein
MTVQGVLVLVPVPAVAVAAVLAVVVAAVLAVVVAAVLAVVVAGRNWEEVRSVTSTSKAVWIFIMRQAGDLMRVLVIVEQEPWTWRGFITSLNWDSWVTILIHIPLHT